jgi:hypothetical protein
MSKSETGGEVTGPAVAAPVVGATASIRVTAADGAAWSTLALEFQRRLS